ncbi:UDP-2,3-diacylglucosamine diphosphatase [Legionella pneumophila]|uniref:UDP-2,3-diacylglucosamine hydrolase n=1 Tax=Legionella pneumophila subsp. pascullei TaxID=91890 RepID=A0AAX2IYU4_LEGPN|nr:UDP-2,3-diacylglucosamine diphosphatase [Legionella pneumophila]AMP89798.1 UDP-2,3-diacylglucosamine diphosphatase [Legionella pneumophila subsp. pascullei]AMP92536.1 UDP-2,3-diacylglucosamine hydrolase [Legionella pneumophila subsp. pascullei]AMP95502.1 UDP-2,3-diacylglucosamine hydrolase [Legionella pneumophila subsp. pascullei]SQG90408.1 UDP-2,3-diacylglucosamine hydrolase [Legionella pneumophila subsp. pascullei]VEH06648.1 UDP-2,3-diacylglucosamine hydrolase [Legionella pneumophila subs
MIESVFISDLHLHPEDDEIQARFHRFINWARNSVRKIYILGDFFHAWSGDDSINAWSDAIAKQIKSLTQSGIEIYFMTGNRDFLLGSSFAKRTGWKILTEPTVITLGNNRILLAHGDRYCTSDRSHQRFRLLTRNRCFSFLFLRLPLSIRNRMVSGVRKISLNNHHKSIEQMDVVKETAIRHMHKNNTEILIHGHTHKPGLTNYSYEGKILTKYVLSDWDDIPKLLCYDNTKGFYFTQYDIN